MNSSRKLINTHYCTFSLFFFFTDFSFDSCTTALLQYSLHSLFWKFWVTTIDIVAFEIEIPPTKRAWESLQILLLGTEIRDPLWKLLLSNNEIDFLNCGCNVEPHNEQYYVILKNLLSCSKDVLRPGSKLVKMWSRRGLKFFFKEYLLYLFYYLSESVQNFNINKLIIGIHKLWKHH